MSIKVANSGDLRTRIMADAILSAAQEWNPYTRAALLEICTQEGSNAELLSQLVNYRSVGTSQLLQINNLPPRTFSTDAADAWSIYSQFLFDNALLGMNRSFQRELLEHCQAVSASCAYLHILQSTSSIESLDLAIRRIYEDVASTFAATPELISFEAIRAAPNQYLPVEFFLSFKVIR